MSLGAADRERFEQRRAQRKHDVKPQVIRETRDVRLARARGERVHLRLVRDDPDRPRTRSACINGPRPCPWVSCRHHLYLEVTKAGSLRVYHPDLEPDELEHSCSLDVADDGGASLESIGSMLNVTRERARQIEDDAIRAMVQSGGAALMAEAAPDDE